MQAKFLDDAVEDDRQIKPLALVCESRASITWYRIPNTEWGEDDPAARIAEAVRWYNPYCIHLTFDEFSLNPNNPQERRIRDELNRLVPEYNARVARIPRARGALERLLNDAHSSVLSIYQQIARKVGKDRIVVIFLDEWYVLVGVTDNPNHWREFRISANDGQRLLVGLDRYDTRSPHILTHELLHALRKKSGRSNRDCIRDFVRANRVTNLDPRPWQDHYSGVNQNRAMSFTDRATAFQPFRKRDEDVITVREYLTILQGGYVRSAPGCNCEKRRDRERGKKEDR
ncbi:MAG: hypothetical protein ACREQK_16450 [Candidatus Binatia bacterium]